MSDFEPSSHHPLGPSVWPAIAECADFEAQHDVDLEDIDADDESADRSAKARGTAQHKAVAMLLSGDLGARQRALDGLSEPERDQVRWVVDAALQIAAEHGYQPHEIKVEQRVRMLRPDSFETLYFGTCDIEFGPITIDAKFGLQRNYFPQLVGYTLPRMEQLNEMRRFGYLLYGRLKRIEKFVITKETAELVGYGLLARRASPHRRPTACSYCSWCTKKATCPAITAPVLDLASKREDWSLRVTQAHVSRMANDPVAAGAALWVWKAYLEQWGGGAEFAARSMAERGITPLGFRRQESKGSLKVTKPAKALGVLRMLGVPEDAIEEAISVSMTALVKACTASLGMSEDAAKKRLADELTKAGAAQLGDPTFKLVRLKDGEDLLRAALPRLDRTPERPIEVLAREQPVQVNNPEESPEMQPASAVRE